MPVQTQIPASRNTGSTTTAATSNVQQAYVPQIQKTVSREQLLVNMDDHGMIFFSVTNSIINNKVAEIFIFFNYFFGVRLLSVLRGHSVFSYPPQRPMTSDSEGWWQK